MLHRKDLEALHPTTLAVLCDRLAKNCKDTRAASKGRELKAEWALLQTPPSLSWKEEKQKDEKRWDVRNQMIELLVCRDEVEFYPKQ